MLSVEQDEHGYRVYYRSYRIALALLVLPPLVMAEYLPMIADDSIDASGSVALALGILMPLLAAYLLTEFASFSFSHADGLFRYHWRNPLRRKAMELPLERVVRVRREALETAYMGSAGLCYRLIVQLDDDRIIGLTRRYSSLQERELKHIVDQIREYLGHIVPMR